MAEWLGLHTEEELGELRARGPLKKGEVVIKGGIALTTGGAWLLNPMEQARAAIGERVRLGDLDFDFERLKQRKQL